MNFIKLGEGIDWSHPENRKPRVRNVKRVERDEKDNITRIFEEEYDEAIHGPVPSEFLHQIETVVSQSLADTPDTAPL